MPGLTKNDWKGLWAVLWRALIFGPILGLLGAVLMFLVIAAFVLPPVYAALAFFTGDWIFGLMALVGWGVVLWFRRPILDWTMEGFEYAGI
jgi:hypothetical protein